MFVENFFIFYSTSKKYRNEERVWGLFFLLIFISLTKR